MAHFPQVKRLQTIDPLDQLAICCGMGNRRPKNYRYPTANYYGPHMDPQGGWTVAEPYNGHHQAALQGQPYILLSQPVIITANPSQGQTNTMTLVQHAQTAQDLTGMRNFPVLGTVSQQQVLQPSLFSSRYAIYSSTAALGNANSQLNHQSLACPVQQNTYLRDSLREAEANSQYQASKAASMIGELPLALTSNQKQQAERQHQRVKTLDADMFKQLEMIEKQVDLSNDMVLIERYGTVITRAIDPISLRPHLTDARLRKYQSLITVNDDYVIRFIEIIKRPGQTLGLYIRSVQIDQGRDGLVITKIESDSPIYNSRVVHIGDEILSVNLIDVQGLSIDDIVIIMSIPRRLVLTLRVPADRDPLFASSEPNRQRFQHPNQTQLFNNQADILARDFGTIDARGNFVELGTAGIGLTSSRLRESRDTRAQRPNSSADTYLNRNLIRNSQIPSSMEDPTSQLMDELRRTLARSSPLSYSGGALDFETPAHNTSRMGID